MYWLCIEHLKSENNNNKYVDECVDISKLLESTVGFKRLCKLPYFCLKNIYTLNNENLMGFYYMVQSPTFLLNIPFYAIEYCLNLYTNTYTFIAYLHFCKSNIKMYCNINCPRYLYFECCNILYLLKINENYIDHLQSTLIGNCCLTWDIEKKELVSLISKIKLTKNDFILNTSNFNDKKCILNFDDRRIEIYKKPLIFIMKEYLFSFFTKLRNKSIELIV